MKTYPNKCLLKNKSCKNPKLNLKVKFKGKCSEKKAQNESNKKGMKRFWIIMFDLIEQIHDLFHVKINKQFINMVKFNLFYLVILFFICLFHRKINFTLRNSDFNCMIA